MKTPKQSFFGPLLGTLVLAATPLAAFAGIDDLTKECDECHGRGGNSTEHQEVPSIAGFSTEALEDMLTQFKEGDRKGVEIKEDDGDETDMNKESEELSAADISALAEHYAAQTFVPHKQDFDAVLARRGAKVHDKSCEKCHSDGGSNADDDAAILAGQWRAYLEDQMADIAAGERSVPKKMKKKFKKLQEKDLKALIEFYVSQQ